MDFSLTDDQVAFRQTARQFAQKELKPNAAEWDCTILGPLGRRFYSLFPLGVTGPGEPRKEWVNPVCPPPWLLWARLARLVKGRYA